MTDCVKPSPGKFKSHFPNVASSALIDDKTNEICVSLPSLNLSSTCKLFIYDIYLSWQFLASVRQSCSPLAFPNSRIFHRVTPCKQDGGKKVGNKRIISLREYFTSKSDEGLSETCLLTCHTHKSKWNLHASLKTGSLCATHDFHALILNHLWEIVNIMTYDSFHSLHLETHQAATIIYSLKQTLTLVYDGCLEIRRSGKTSCSAL